MNRRAFLAAAGLPWLGIPGLGEVPGLSIHGRLTRSADGRPVLESNSKKPAYLEGDAETMLVLNDKRLLGTDFEAIGHFNSPDHFQIDGFHNRAMFVHKDGKRLMISYWCDVCYIRTWAPGVCVCCQKYTDLDLGESFEP